MSVMLAITGFYAWGNTIDQILQTWADMGVFRYVLPFLLIFAVVFGILTKSEILGKDSKGVNVVIALAVGLLALQFEFIPQFFATIFPYAGIGISILLVGLILTGLFRPEKDDKWWNWTFFGIGMLIFVVIAILSLSEYSWGGGWWWQENWQAIITFAIIIGLMIVVIFATKKKSD